MEKSARLVNIKENLKKFFNSPLYPMLVGAMMLLAHVFGIELYVHFVNAPLCALAFLVCDSIKPFIVVLCTFVFQASRLTLDCNIDTANNFYSGWRIALAIVAVGFVLICAVYFYIKHKKISPEKLKSLPMLPAAAFLSLAFLLNGAFSAGWSFGTLSYGAIQVLCFFVLFYLFLLGFDGEDREELVRYFALVTAVIASVLVLEVGWLYISNDELFVNGAIVKEEVQFGWGNWNTMGQQLVMTIPMLFYGVMKCRFPWIYFGIATLATLGAVLTLSRNALIFAVLTYCACCVIACFFGRMKKAFRVLIPLGILGLVLFAVIFREKILNLLDDYVNRGLSDNGRFDLWREGLEGFLEAPIFGKGFYGLYPEFEFTGGVFPWMAHNTVVELLGALGIFGLVAYLFYRFETVRIFVCRPSLEKTLLGMSMLTIILGSLLDNFLFYVQPMFYYSIALAIAYKLSEEKEKAHLSEKTI